MSHNYHEGRNDYFELKERVGLEGVKEARIRELLEQGGSLLKRLFSAPKVLGIRLSEHSDAALVEMCFVDGVIKYTDWEKYYLNRLLKRA